MLRSSAVVSSSERHIASSPEVIRRRATAPARTSSAITLAHLLIDTSIISAVIDMSILTCQSVWGRGHLSAPPSRRVPRAAAELDPVGVVLRVEVADRELDGGVLAVEVQAVDPQQRLTGVAAQVPGG